MKENVPDLKEAKLKALRCCVEQRKEQAESELIALLAFMGSTAYQAQGPEEHAKLDQLTTLQARYADALEELLAIPWIVGKEEHAIL